MNYSKKALVVIIILVFTIGAALYAISTPRQLEEKVTPPKIMEIYTVDNIYYVFGLNVTSEMSDEYITFKNQDNLNEYISEVTANDAAKGIECLRQNN